MTIMTTPRALRLDPSDNVIIAIDDIAAGSEPAGVSARQRVPKGHKMAVVRVEEGAPIRKFGQIIGFASQAIAPGEWVHEHNCAVKDFARDYHFGEDTRRENILPVEEQPTFQGFRRANGKVGTRNYLAVLTSVNCSATVARLIAKEVERSDILADYPNVDGVIALVHGTGCGIAAKGVGFDALMRTQWGYAGNPNIGATLMVGLGCEVFQIGRMKEEYGIVESDSFHSLTIQATGGTRKTVAAGVDHVRTMLPLLNSVERAPAPGERTDACAPVRGFGRLLGHHRQSRPWRGGRYPGAQRRHGDSFGDAGDLWRGTFADPARRDAGNRPQARRAHPLVGGLLRAQWRRNEQQSLARKQGRRLDDHPREIAGRSREGRHDRAQRGLRIRPAGHRQGLRVHGYAGL